MYIYLLLMSLFVAFSVHATRAIEPTEKYALARYTYVGLFEKQGRRIALLRDPQGTVYRVQIGNFVGEHHGSITQIHDDYIQVKEQIAICGRPGEWVGRFNYIARQGIELKGKKRDDLKARTEIGQDGRGGVCLAEK